MKKLNFKRTFLFLSLLVFCFVTKAQVTSITGLNYISGSTPIALPSQLCLAPTETITIRYNFAGTQVAGTPFQIYLVDPSGLPANDRLVFTSPSSGVTNGTVSANATFTLPSTNFGLTTPLSGIGYRFRVKYVGVSFLSAAFEAYIKPFDTRIQINNNRPNLILCGTPVTVSIDNIPGGPLSAIPTIPNTSYQWFKTPSTTPIGTGTSIVISSIGDYYVKINYGNCSDNTISNLQVTSSSSVALSISSSNGNTICGGSSTTLSASITTGSGYQWLDGSNNPIPGATSSSYTATTSGTYKVRLNTGACTIESTPYTLNVQTTTLTTSPSGTSLIIPGQTIPITATVSNNQALTTWAWTPAGSTNNTFNASTAGVYCVNAQQTGVPCAPISLTSCVTMVYPTSYGVNIGTTGFTACQSNSATINIVNFQANYATSNVNLLSTYQSLSGIQYKWKFNGVPNGNVSNSQNVTQSGTYQLDITMADGTIINTNNLVIGLKSNDVFAINATGGLCSNTSQVQLAATVTNGLPLSSYTYVWQKDGATIAPTTATITVSEAGTYKVTAKNIFGCEFTATYVLNPTFISDISFDKPSTVFLPIGSTLVISGLGGDSYSWTQNGNFLSTSASSGPITQAGIVKVSVTKGLCIFMFEFDIKSGTSGGNPEIVPNLISPNNDSFNDKWELPVSILQSNNFQVGVEIYDNLGKIVLQTDNYLNDWPSSDFTSYNTNSVFYYVIKSNQQQEIQKGTLTLLK
jgi:large repetitive protein